MIRQAINNKSKKSISIQSIFHNNNVVNDPCEIAYLFNQFFSNVAHEIVNQIHPTINNLENETFNSPSYFPSFSFSENPITLTETSDAITQLKNKNSQDADGISSNFL